MKCNVCGWNETPDALPHLKRTVEACMNTGPCMDRTPVVVWRDNTFEVVDEADVISVDDKKKKLVADRIIDLELERHIAPPTPPEFIPLPEIKEEATVEVVTGDKKVTETVTVIPQGD